jgi:hypothetical protein
MQPAAAHGRTFQERMKQAKTRRKNEVVVREATYSLFLFSAHLQFIVTVHLMELQAQESKL